MNYCPAFKLVALLLLVSPAGCYSWHRQPARPASDPTADTPMTLSVQADLGWMGKNRHGILIQKSRRILILFDRGRPYKVYPIVLGGNPSGPKLYEGDLHTPTGIYRIVNKSRHLRWSRFMLINYPSPLDRSRHRLAMAKGMIPLINGRRPGPGGAIGIHGTDKGDLNNQGIDWTWGCVSLNNKDVEELYDLVPLGTPIRIEE